MANYQTVTEALNGLLASGTVFYQKLRHYHWNVEGREFFELHAKFEQLYTVWAEHLDAIAERILMLDEVPLHTLSSLLGAARLEEDESIPAAPQMVNAVVADLNALHAVIDEATKLAEAADDRGTVNLLDELRGGVEKEVWMLGAWRSERAQSWS